MEPYVLGFMVLCHHSFSSYLTGSKITCELWLVYEKVYSSSAQTVRKENNYVDDYMIKIKSLTNSLSEIGEQIISYNLILYVVIGLNMI